MLRIASWNIEGRLSRYSGKGRGTPEQIVHGISQLDADIVLLPEAYDTGLSIDSGIEANLRDMKYTVYDSAYEEGGPKRRNPAVSSPHLRLLSRLPIESIQTVRLGELRNAMIIIAHDPDTHIQLRIIGIHLDDRSEAFRVKQLDDLVPIINGSSVPTIMLGDYNAMHGSTKRAHFIRSWPIRWLAHYFLPTTDLRDIAQRMVAMASGITMSILESETDLRDIDLRHRATATPKMRGHTWLPSVRLIDIDHMMVSSQVTVNDFIVAEHDGGSDHRSICATLSFE